MNSSARQIINVVNCKVEVLRKINDLNDDILTTLKEEYLPWHEKQIKLELLSEEVSKICAAFVS